MKVESTSSSAREYELDLEGALVAFCRLSDEAVEQIHAAMRSGNVSFGEAAVHCAAVTQHELDEATAWVRQSAMRRSPGIVETALNRRDPNRGTVVVQHTGTVKPGAQLLSVYAPYSSRSERIRALRTELLLLEERTNQGRALALLSPAGGEGRSLLASELAISFAQLGRRTLLVDADLRRPSLHAMFGSENAWGLAQALSLAEPPRLLAVEGLPHLSLLIAGPHTQNPLELLSDGRFERLVSDWRRHFEQIVLDTPPVSLFADALAIATIANSAVIVSRAASTAHRDMKEMLRRLASTQARILGAVMNHF